jgi:hypothetical protein
MAARGVYGSCDTLMARAFRHSRQPAAIARYKLDAAIFGEQSQIPSARVAPTTVKKNFSDAGRVLPQTAGNRVETEHETISGHRQTGRLKR